MYKSIRLFFVSLLLTIVEANAQNPVLKGFADPALQVFNGKMYMVVGNDKDIKFTYHTMPFWDIYSTTDLINWKLEVRVDPKDTYLGAGYRDCWAADITEKNGKYYFYFSNKNQATGVLVADKPEGPYIDVLKKPFLSAKLTDNHEYDPTIFTDDDGEKYILFGRDGMIKDEIHHYQFSRVNKDMLSLAETPRDLLTSEQYGFGNKARAADHSYLHKYNGLYYLSCAGAYMTSKNIYGPYSNLRETGQNGHSSFKEYNGQWFRAWEWTCDPYEVRMYRQVMLSYIHYKDNGDMVDDKNFMKGGKYYENGVGSYSAKWDKIEAEWYFKKSENAQKRESPKGGFELQNFKNGDYLNFPYVKDLKKNATINFSISSKNEGGKIEIHQGSSTGKVLGTCIIPKTDSFSKYQLVSCKLDNVAGTANLYFVFKGRNDELARLDFFNFL